MRNCAAAAKMLRCAVFAHLRKVFHLRVDAQLRRSGENVAQRGFGAIAQSSILLESWNDADLINVQIMKVGN